MIELEYEKINETIDLEKILHSLNNKQQNEKKEKR